jgi:hypothetical protein
LLSGSKCVEVKKYQATHKGVADLKNTLKTDQGLIVDFTSGQRIRVIVEVAKKPIQLPESFGGAVEASGKSAAGEMLGLKNREHYGVKGFVFMPAVLSFLNADEKKVVGDRVYGGAVSRTEALEIASTHAAPRPRGL